MNRMKNALSEAIGLGKNKDLLPTDAAAQQPNSDGNTVAYRNVIDLIETFDRRSRLAALRSITGAVQFKLISTADWIVRKEEQNAASANPTLDERNEQDEWHRGEDPVMVGMEEQEDPHTTLKNYTHLYYGLVDLIRKDLPQAFERPKGLVETLKEYTPRNAELSPDVMKALEAIEDEPGEFQRIRDENTSRKAAKMAERKPRIKELLELNADCNPMVEIVLELPIDARLRLATAAWKGVFYSRKQLVSYIASTGKADDIGTVQVMKADADKLKNWCLDFEAEHSAVFEALIDVGRRVYGIADAETDVKKPRQQ